MSQIILGDNVDYLAQLENGCIDLVYIDPPFNTGRDRRHTRIKTERTSEGGDRTGFGGKRYKTSVISSIGYGDSFEDFAAFLSARLGELWRVLSPKGSLFFHIDWREVHYCKVLLDSLFGRRSFMNEIIWAYDYGARSKRKWSTKHDNILWYVKDPENYTFNFDEMDRIPYMAPGLVGKEKAARGKTPTDVWWHTIVPTNGKERTGYPTQKPLGILERIIKVHSNPGDMVLDCFAGSGTTGEAAALHGRQFILMDVNPEAVRIQSQRLLRFEPTCVGFDPASSNPAGLEPA
jgi:site-specific DNA-methyltransferase (adenine-specific)